MTPFDNDLYLKIQKEAILDRIHLFGEKLYLEFGGKLFDDYHASRVLPGFKPDSKLQLLLSLKNQSEIIIAINSMDIKNQKIRGDLGITYDVEVERLIMKFMQLGLNVCGVVFSFYEKSKVVDTFMRKLKNLGVPTYKHYKIEGYPQDVERIVSKSGFGQNDYVKTSKPLVVVTAPGPGSGKMETCLSQLYFDHLNGIKSGYAKYETFPVANLPLSHPANVAYESATVDLMDENMIDPYHLEAYGVLATNYNRDISAFPLLKDLLTSLTGNCPYKSPTDMGVNKIGYAIKDDEQVKKAANDEIIRRYYQINKDYLLGKVEQSALDKINLLLSKSNLSIQDRKCVFPCLVRANKEESPCVSIELKDGFIVTGRRSELLTASSAALINALKHLSNIDDEVLLLSRNIIKPINDMKVEKLHQANPKIHVDEILIALSISANTNENAKKAISHIGELEGCEAHASCLLADVDYRTLFKLGLRVTEEAKSYIYKVSLT